MLLTTLQPWQVATVPDSLPTTGTARQAALILAVNAGVGLLLWAWLRRVGRTVMITLLGLLLVASLAVGLGLPDPAGTGLPGEVITTPFRTIFTALAGVGLIGVLLIGADRSVATAAPALAEADLDPRLLWKRLDQGVDPSDSGDEPRDQTQ
jgi:hypothetical protein